MRWENQAGQASQLPRIAEHAHSLHTGKTMLFWPLLREAQPGLA